MATLARDVRNEVTLAPDQAPLRLAQNTIMGLTGGVPAAWDEVAVYDHAFSAAEAMAAYLAKARGCRPLLPTAGS